MFCFFVFVALLCASLPYYHVACNWIVEFLAKGCFRGQNMNRLKNASGITLLCLWGAVKCDGDDATQLQEADCWMLTWDIMERDALSLLYIFFSHWPSVTVLFYSEVLCIKTASKSCRLFLPYIPAVCVCLPTLQLKAHPHYHWEIFFLQSYLSRILLQRSFSEWQTVTLTLSFYILPSVPSLVSEILVSCPEFQVLLYPALSYCLSRFSFKL